MPSDIKVYLEDILTAAEKIESYISDLSFEKFTEDCKTFDAVIRNLEIIGEAAKKLRDDENCQYSEIDWKKMAGLRDILIHEYFGVDAEIVWDVVQNKLPDLVKYLHGKLTK